MKTELIKKIIFEENDVFICVADDGAGGNYKTGDFIQITALASTPYGGMHSLRTSATVDGRASSAVGGSEWLEAKLKGGLFEYIGNVTK